jgi:hypothetical protein
MICCCCSSKICWWWATSVFGGKVKFEILVAQGQPHHFWISETLHWHWVYTDFTHWMHIIFWWKL